MQIVPLIMDPRSGEPPSPPCMSVFGRQTALQFMLDLIASRHVDMKPLNNSWMFPESAPVVLAWLSAGSLFPLSSVVQIREQQKQHESKVWACRENQ